MWFKKKEKTFDTSIHRDCFILRNQTQEINDCEKRDIVYFLNIMFDDIQEFVVLQPLKPIHDVQFIQAAQAKNAIEVEVGIEKEGRCHLVYKNYSKEECQQIFLDFFSEGKLPSLEDYQPVEFM